MSQTTSRFFSPQNRPAAEPSVSGASLLRPANVPAIPACSPSYFKGPFIFYDREYFIIAFRTTPEAIAKALPAPIKPVGDNIVLYEFMNMPNSPGLGSYSETGILIPGIFNGKEVNFTSQMYLDSDPAIYAGREIWGFPKKRGNSLLHAEEDTLIGTLHMQGKLIAMGTMPYKAEEILARHNHASNPEGVALVTKKLTKPQLNLKVIPSITGKDDIRQLIQYIPQVIAVKEAWKGQARLDLRAHVEANVADFPILEVIGGTHMLADIILPYGEVVHDYLKAGDGTIPDDAEPVTTPSIPMVSPSYNGLGHHLFYDREHFVVHCRTTPGAILSALPSPLEPDGDIIQFSFMKFQDSPGFGAVTETSIRIPCTFKGKRMTFVNQVYADSGAAQYGGRELWGLPMKRGKTELVAEEDTLVGRLMYGKHEVATATMPFKAEAVLPKHISNPELEAQLKEELSIPRVSLKIMPEVDGTISHRQLVQFTPEIIKIHEVWEGPARINLVPHVNAPVADFPILETLGAAHYTVDMSLPLGSVIHDYLKSE